jgi:hypothetical protein
MIKTGTIGTAILWLFPAIRQAEMETRQTIIEGHAALNKVIEQNKQAVKKTCSAEPEQLSRYK